MVQGILIDENNCIINKNPATGEIISKVKCTSVTECDEIIKNANNGKESWFLETSIKERINLLKECIQEIKKIQNELISMIVDEMGKTRREATDEMNGAIEKDEYFTILSDSLQSKQHGSCTVIRQAYGVVIILSPWNFPVDEILLLLLPALASGNTVIVKPSEVTPETGALVVNTISKILPKDVLQLVQGDGKIGSYLVSHPNIDMIAMTGSCKTGQLILQQAAAASTTTASANVAISNGNKKIKRFILEMGGKDPMVVFDDIMEDNTLLEKAVYDAIHYSIYNAGQVCCSIERIYVPETIYDKFSNLIVEYLTNKGYKVGHGKNDDVQIGPMVSKIQYDIVKGQIDDAIKKGAKVLYQSDISLPTENNSNNDDDNLFFPITVVANVTSDMDIITKETFGPVITLIKYTGTEKDAILLANDTEYGLASSIYTKDLKKAKRVANAIQSGQVGINCYSLDHLNVACPWVGHKSSGFGYHSGMEGFHQFSIPKTVVFEEKEDEE